MSGAAYGMWASENWGNPTVHGRLNSIFPIHATVVGNSFEALRDPNGCEESENDEGIMGVQ